MKGRSKGKRAAAAARSTQPSPLAAAAAPLPAASPSSQASKRARQKRRGAAAAAQGEDNSAAASAVSSAAPTPAASSPAASPERGANAAATRAITAPTAGSNGTSPARSAEAAAPAAPSASHARSLSLHELLALAPGAALPLDAAAAPSSSPPAAASSPSSSLSPRSRQRAHHARSFSALIPSGIARNAILTPSDSGHPQQQQQQQQRPASLSLSAADRVALRAPFVSVAAQASILSAVHPVAAPLPSVSVFTPVPAADEPEAEPDAALPSAQQRELQQQLELQEGQARVQQLQLQRLQQQLQLQESLLQQNAAAAEPPPPVPAAAASASAVASAPSAAGSSGSFLESFFPSPLPDGVQALSAMPVATSPSSAEPSASPTALALGAPLDLAQVMHPQQHPPPSAAALASQIASSPPSADSVLSPVSALLAQPFVGSADAAAAIAAASSDVTAIPAVPAVSPSMDGVAAAAPSEMEAIALHDFLASQPGQLSVSQGQMLPVLGKALMGWIRVADDRGRSGHVPEAYVSLRTKGDKTLPASMSNHRRGDSTAHFKYTLAASSPLAASAGAAPAIQEEEETNEQRVSNDALNSESTIADLASTSTSEKPSDIAVASNDVPASAVVASLAVAASVLAVELSPIASLAPVAVATSADDSDALTPPATGGGGAVSAGASAAIVAVAAAVGTAVAPLSLPPATPDTPNGGVRHYVITGPNGSPIAAASQDQPAAREDDDGAAAPSTAGNSEASAAVALAAPAASASPSAASSSSDSSSFSSSSSTVVALFPFVAQSPGQLSIAAEEVLTLLGPSELDGWLTVRNARGDRGHVPQSYCARGNSISHGSGSRSSSSTQMHDDGAPLNHSGEVNSSTSNTDPHPATLFATQPLDETVPASALSSADTFIPPASLFPSLPGVAVSADETKQSTVAENDSFAVPASDDVLHSQSSASVRHVDPTAIQTSCDEGPLSPSGAIVSGASSSVSSASSSSPDAPRIGGVPQQQEAVASSSSSSSPPTLDDLTSDSLSRERADALIAIAVAAGAISPPLAVPSTPSPSSAAAVALASSPVHAHALYSFDALSPGQLGFREGERLRLLDRPVSGWVLASNEQGRRGHVPAQYLDDAGGGSGTMQLAPAAESSSSRATCSPEALASALEQAAASHGGPPLPLDSPLFDASNMAHSTKELSLDAQEQRAGAHDLMLSPVAEDAATADASAVSSTASSSEPATVPVMSSATFPLAAVRSVLLQRLDKPYAPFRAVPFLRARYDLRNGVREGLKDVQRRLASIGSSTSSAVSDVSDTSSSPSSDATESLSSLEHRIDSQGLGELRADLENQVDTFVRLFHAQQPLLLTRAREAELAERQQVAGGDDATAKQWIQDSFFDARAVEADAAARDGLHTELQERERLLRERQDEMQLQKQRRATLLSLAAAEQPAGAAAATSSSSSSSAASSPSTLTVPAAAADEANRSSIVYNADNVPLPATDASSSSSSAGVSASAPVSAVSTPTVSGRVLFTPTAAGAGSTRRVLTRAPRGGAGAAPLAAFSYLTKLESKLTSINAAMASNLEPPYIEEMHVMAEGPGASASASVGGGGSRLSVRITDTSSAPILTTPVGPGSGSGSDSNSSNGSNGGASPPSVVRLGSSSPLVSSTSSSSPGGTAANNALAVPRVKKLRNTRSVSAQKADTLAEVNERFALACAVPAPPAKLRAASVGGAVRAKVPKRVRWVEDPTKLTVYAPADAQSFPEPSAAEREAEAEAERQTKLACSPDDDEDAPWGIEKQVQSPVLLSPMAHHTRTLPDPNQTFALPPSLFPTQPAGHAHTV